MKDFIIKVMLIRPDNRDLFLWSGVEVNIHFQCISLISQKWEKLTRGLYQDYYHWPVSFQQCRYQNPLSWHLSLDEVFRWQWTRGETGQLVTVFSEPFTDLLPRLTTGLSVNLKITWFGILKVLFLDAAYCSIAEFC